MKRSWKEEDERRWLILEIKEIWPREEQSAVRRRKVDGRWWWQRVEWGEALCLAMIDKDSRLARKVSYVLYIWKQSITVAEIQTVSAWNTIALLRITSGQSAPQLLL